MSDELAALQARGKVWFRQMKDGTDAEWAFLRMAARSYRRDAAQRIIKDLALQERESIPGYQVNRLQHCLQAATRAYRQGADVDWVVAALLHDIGDGIAPLTHDKMAAELVRPFVREECAWVVAHHGAFQLYYYGHHYGLSRHEREKQRGDPHFESCAAFCERWDQSSFDPDYHHEPLSFFEPMVEAVFSRQPFDPATIQAGVITGLSSTSDSR